MNLPESFLQQLEAAPGFEKEAFVAAHLNSPVPVAIRLNASKITDSGQIQLISEQAQPILLSNSLEPVPWCRQAYYLPARPSFTFDPLFHAGAYYVQEASGMFIEQVLKQYAGGGSYLRILDLCAAPGGKSTLLQSLMDADSLLVSNEVIRSRANLLVENITKWGALNVIVTQNDPEDFRALEHFFDIILVDAPCSGSGLFRKEPDAVLEWSPQAVELCSQRQQRILADVYPALKKGGLLIYTTCSYAPEEDEGIADWMLEHFQLESLPVTFSPDWGIVETRTEQQRGYGYRFWPHRLKGEGFFLSAFKKLEGDSLSRRRYPKKKLQPLPGRELPLCREWISEDIPVSLVQHAGQVIALPQLIEQDAQQVIDAGLHLVKAGVKLGKIAGSSLVPDHSLALCPALCRYPVAISLNLEQALQYLRIDDLILADEAVPSGWVLVRYRDISLGWLKKIARRFNNYYPREWRIRKQLKG